MMLALVSKFPKGKLHVFPDSLVLLEETDDCGPFLECSCMFQKGYAQHAVQHLPARICQGAVHSAKNLVHVKVLPGAVINHFLRLDSRIEIGAHMLINGPGNGHFFAPPIPQMCERLQAARPAVGPIGQCRQDRSRNEQRVIERRDSLAQQECAVTADRCRTGQYILHSSPVLCVHGYLLIIVVFTLAESAYSPRGAIFLDVGTGEAKLQITRCI